MHRMGKRGSRWPVTAWLAALLWAPPGVHQPRLFNSNPPLPAALEGRTFFCPHCGALYSATPSLVPRSEGDAAKCVVCLKVMDLGTTKVPSFKLIQRPEDT